MPTHPVHYGTLNGPACGARFGHEGLTARWDTLRVTCKRCLAGKAYRADLAELNPVASKSAK